MKIRIPYEEVPKNLMDQVAEELKKLGVETEIAEQGDRTVLMSTNTFPHVICFSLSKNNGWSEDLGLSYDDNYFNNYLREVVILAVEKKYPLWWNPQGGIGAEQIAKHAYYIVKIMQIIHEDLPKKLQKSWEKLSKTEAEVSAVFENFILEKMKEVR